MMKKQKKVMIVEDEALTSLDLAMQLGDHGFIICQQAATGEEAIRIAAEEEPDIVLMDVNLPGTVDGIAAAETILARRPVVFVFMTGYSTAEEMARIHKLQPLAYLIKPISLDDVMPLMDALPEGL
jgi:YesN/AraC family two-component response regulator